MTEVLAPVCVTAELKAARVRNSSSREKGTGAGLTVLVLARAPVLSDFDAARGRADWPNPPRRAGSGPFLLGKVAAVFERRARKRPTPHACGRCVSRVDVRVKAVALRVFSARPTTVSLGERRCGLIIWIARSNSFSLCSASGDYLKYGKPSGGAELCIDCWN